MTHKDRMVIPDEMPQSFEEFKKLYDQAVEICDKRITGFLLRLRERSPFFSLLAMYAKYKPVMGGTAFTDGKDVHYNPLWMVNTKREVFDGILLHEILHAAFHHTFRCGMRDPDIWNYAADIVVNDVVKKQPYLELIDGAIVDDKLADLSVEEIYAILSQRSKKAKKKVQQDRNKAKQQGKQNPSWMTEPGQPQTGQDNSGDDDSNSEQCKSKGQATPQERGNGYGGCMHGQPEADGQGKDGNPDPTKNGQLSWDTVLEEHWKNALNQAEAAAMMSADGQGSIPAGMERFLGQAKQPQIDWRSKLAQFIIRTPVDFGFFDRRFIHDELYIEALDSLSVEVDVCIDTSGSVGDEEMSVFLGEVKGIIKSYPHVKARLFYADAALYGPWPITLKEDPPKPVGGGGTCFKPFFKFIEEEKDNSSFSKVLIYLTDGYGSFPDDEPKNFRTLWIVVPNGLRNEEFPFGEVTRLLEV